MNAPKYIINTSVVALVDGIYHLGSITGGYSYENQWWYHLNDGNNVTYANENAIIYHLREGSWVNTDETAQVSTIYSNPS